MLDMAGISRYWHDGSIWNHIRITSGHDDEKAFNESGNWEARHLLEHCPNYVNMTLLDWGCGSGRITQYLAGKFRHTHGVDVAPGMIDKLVNRKLDKLTASVIDGVNLPPGKYDIIYSFACWMHVPKIYLPSILKTCAAALADNGRILFQLPIYAAPRDIDAPWDITCWTPDEFRSVAEGAGLRVFRIHANHGTFGGDNIGVNHFRLHELRLPTHIECDSHNWTGWIC